MHPGHAFDPVSVGPLLGGAWGDHEHLGRCGVGPATVDDELSETQSSAWPAAGSFCTCRPRGLGRPPGPTSSTGSPTHRHSWRPEHQPREQRNLRNGGTPRTARSGGLSHPTSGHDNLPDARRREPGSSVDPGCPGQLSAAPPCCRVSRHRDGSQPGKLPARSNAPGRDLPNRSSSQAAVAVIAARSRPLATPIRSKR